MSFKIPRLKSKPPDRDLFSGLRRFLLDEVTDQKDIGVGSYGLVKFGRYPTDEQQSRDVVVKIPRDITGYEKEFAKEAKLLNSVKGHPNIVSFKAVSVSPFAIMTEYLKFSFEPFADQKSVNSLADFLSHVHSQYDFNGFEQVVPVIAKNSRKKASVGEAYDKILLCKRFLYFESIPILRLLVPGNFSRRKIGPEGCAQKFNANGARLQ